MIINKEFKTICQITTSAKTWSSLTFGLLCLSRAYFVMKAESCGKSFLFSFAAESFLFVEIRNIWVFLGTDGDSLGSTSDCELVLVGINWSAGPGSWTQPAPLFLPGIKLSETLTARASRVIYVWCQPVGNGGRHSLHFSLWQDRLAPRLIWTIYSCGSPSTSSFFPNKFKSAFLQGSPA